MVMMEVIVDQREGVMEMTCPTVTKVALLLVLQKKSKYLVILQIKKHQNRKVVIKLNCRMNIATTDSDTRGVCKNFYSKYS